MAHYKKGTRDQLLQVVAAGMGCTVQDMGRCGFKRLGVPESGVLAPDWMRLANALVGNAEQAAVLEYQMQGPTLLVETAPVKFALCGPAQAHVLHEDGTETPIPAWQSFVVLPGEKARFGAVVGASCAVVAIAGGVNVPADFGSQSTYVRSGFGGLAGRALRNGDCIPISADTVPMQCHMIPDVQHHLYGAGTTGQSHRHVHVVLGPQDDYFTPEAVHAFLNTPYRVTAAIDRMGARLAGQALGHVPCKGAEIISDGVVPGAIQVPGDGQPIVLLQDAQTVGGYPKIATIVSADVPVVATAMPGDCIHFKGVPADAAADYSRAAAARLQQLLRRIIPVDTKPKMNLRALYTTNLISGAVDCLAPDHFPSA